MNVEPKQGYWKKKELVQVRWFYTKGWAEYGTVRSALWQNVEKIQCAAFATPVEQDNGLIMLYWQRSRIGGVTVHRSNDRNYATLKHT